MKTSHLPANRKKTGLNRKILIFVLVIAVCVAAAVIVGRLADARNQQEEPHGDLSTRFTSAPVVEYNGASYTQKKDITTVLVMGIDQGSDDVVESDSYRNGGQADFLLLLVVDTNKQTIQPVQIDRDTMAEITILGVLGNETGTRNAQISLAHGFGDGAEQSCVLQAEAVGRFLLGVNIPYYMAMQMDGISTLNDAVGGVTVTIEDDFTSLDPAMIQGTTMRLSGIQAEYFVRGRMNIGIGTNESRMVRQDQYWTNMTQLMDQRIGEQDGKDFLNDLFDQLDPYLTSNLKRGWIINEVWKSKAYTRLPMLHPAGTYVVGDDGFTEFHADEAALRELALGLFYDKQS